MKILFRQLLVPFSIIKNQPFQFVVWWGVANILGLAGFWLPILILSARRIEVNELFNNLMNSGILSAYSIVILADGIASSLVARGAGSNITAAGIRGVVGVIALVLTIIQIGTLIIETSIDKANISIAFQIIITILSMLISSYLYCFRFNDWEKSVETFQNKEDEEVANLGKSAGGQSADDKGVKL